MLDIIGRFRSTFEPCLLLVHPDIGRLDQIARQLLSSYDWPHLSIGQGLSSALLGEMPERRPLAAKQWMEARTGDLAPGPALCTEVDLLFEPTLSLEPVGLFKHVSRITHLVITWPGTYTGDVLAYAVPDHAHYRTWRDPDLCVVPID